jgi:hypothetical protein
MNGFCSLSSIVLLVASFAVSWIRKFPKIEKYLDITFFRIVPSQKREVLE